MQDDIEDLEEQPLVRHRSRHLPSDSLESSKEVGDIENVEDSPPSSPRQLDSGNNPQHNDDSFPSDEVCPLHIDMTISFFSSISVKYFGAVWTLTFLLNQTEVGRHFLRGA